MENSRQILVVEDNPQNMELVSFLLEDAGHKVIQARNAVEFRQALMRGLPDLILMDIQLPGVDGLSLVQEVRQVPATQRLPILALTAHAMRGDRERFLQAGCDGYLSKPIEISTFVAQVEAFIPAA